MGFSTRGQGFLGKQLVRLFSSLPEKADYFQGNDESCYGFDKSCYMDCDCEHILKRFYRFPRHFYEDILKDILPDDFFALDEERQKGISARIISDMMDREDERYYSLQEKLEKAVKNTEKEVEYNYRIAIPKYDFKKEKISFLFPLMLGDNQQIDLALVVEKLGKKSYQCHTVLRLKEAYMNSRLIAPLSDDNWLKKSVMGRENSEQVTVNTTMKLDLDEDDKMLRHKTMHNLLVVLKKLLIQKTYLMGK